MAPADGPPTVAPPPALSVTLACAHRPGEVRLLQLSLPAGATAADALRAARGQLADLGDLDTDTLDRLSLGLWGRACAPQAALHDGDRLELTRPLIVDPKEARRQRYRRDGLRKRR